MSFQNGTVHCIYELLIEINAEDSSIIGNAGLKMKYVYVHT